MLTDREDPLPRQHIHTAVGKTPPFLVSVVTIIMMMMICRRAGQDPNNVNNGIKIGRTDRR